LLLINIYKQRAKTVLELVGEIKELYKAPTAYAAQDKAQWVTSSTVQDLTEVLAVLKGIEPFVDDAISAQVKAWAKTKNIKMVAIAQPLRIALIGKSSGPGVFELMTALGKHESLVRVQTFMNCIAQEQ
jgi:glutamyl-tRNA synthetase